MNRQHPDDRQIKTWAKSVGGTAKATLLIQTALRCSKSKAEKIAGARYVSKLSATEQVALAKLFEKPVDVLFPLQGKKAS